ncbi:MAG: DUF2202 domain-containing protein [Candidatus Nanopelagicales bacterium]
MKTQATRTKAFAAATAAVGAVAIGAGLLAATPANAADQETVEMLTFMVQEEKMARDLYLEFADEYGVRQFINIATSEQKHMDAVRVLLDRYGIEDPTVGDAIGEFDNAEIQALYDKLYDKGMTSLAKAAKVGITVEKVDIADITDLLEEMPAADITTVLKNLKAGSYNHLDAFRTLRDRVS